MTSTKSSVAQRWLPRAGLLSAAFTTLCCLGISAAGAGGGGALVWVGLAALIAAQLGDAVRVRRCSAVQHPTPKGAP